jgi:hypothetical protein
MPLSQGQMRLFLTVLEKVKFSCSFRILERIFGFITTHFFSNYKLKEIKKYKDYVIFNEFYSAIHRKSITPFLADLNALHILCNAKKNFILFVIGT